MEYELLHVEEIDITFSCHVSSLNIVQTRIHYGPDSICFKFYERCEVLSPPAEVRISAQLSMNVLSSKYFSRMWS